MATAVGRSGPHIESRESVRRTMWEVAAALLPVTAAATVYFGPYSLYLVFASAFASAILERPFAPGGFRWTEPLGDGSAFLAGMLFGLTLAPGSPWWIPLVGSAIVVFVGKQAFGGLGHNVFNPALVARALLLIGYPALVTGWGEPLAWDAVAAATPLEGAPATYLDLFLGRVAGSIGETSVLALLAGATWLFFRGFVGWRISVFYLGSAALTALAFGTDPVAALMSGSLMFAALFLSTDMVTSPVGRTARAVYGIGCGVLTIAIRELSIYPEGTTFAVLIMNGMTPLLDATVVDAFFGQVEKRRRRFAFAAAAAAVALVGAVAGIGALASSRFAGDYYVDGTVRRDLANFFGPQGRYAVPVESAEPGVTVERAYSREGPVGYLVYASAGGYNGPIRVAVALDTDERIIGIRIVDHAESATLGNLVRRPSFLNQFLRRSSANPAAVTDGLVAISGATISSRAVARAVEQALRFSRDPDPSPSGAFGDGTFAGRAGGYQGAIVVSVTVHRGRITDIAVDEHRETRRLAEPAFDALEAAIVSSGRLDVDTVTGATGSSRGYINAVRDALGR